jgi:hypothetical protein
MRSSLATVSFAISVALLAGCSSSPQQGVSTLPGSPSGTSQQSAGYFGSHDASGHITLLKLLKRQADGKLRGPLPQKVLKWQYGRIKQGAHPDLPISSNFKKVSAWASSSFGYLVGQDSSLGKTVADINVNSYCFEPVTVKVDRARNIWTACDSNLSGLGGQVQEFNRNGNAVASYIWNASCTNPSGCLFYGGFGFDSAETSTAVFGAANTYQVYCPTSSSCIETTTTGFVYWTGGPSSTPTFITLPSNTTTGINYQTVYYFDASAQGNIYFDYYGCENYSPYNCGYGLAELRKPTSPSYTVIPLLPPGSIQFPGGVYVSGGGYTLNVTDQLLRTTSRYHLPISPSSTPFRTLGPTAPNYFGLGDPVAGGFNASGLRIGLGDAYGWIDVGRTLHFNKWRDVATTSCAFGCDGFAFTPSDKRY